MASNAVTSSLPALALGVGATREATLDDLAALVGAMLAEAPPGRLSCVASLDRKGRDPAVQGLAKRLSLPLKLFAAAELADIAGTTISDRVAAATGTGSVCEAAALLALGPGARLLVPKRKGSRVTCALAIAAPGPA